MDFYPLGTPREERVICTLVPQYYPGYLSLRPTTVAATRDAFTNISTVQEVEYSTYARESKLKLILCKVAQVDLF